MSNNVWYLTSPDGRVVGASARYARYAIRDARDGAAATEPAVPLSVIGSLYVAIFVDPTATRYEAAGYVLARGEVAVHA